MHITIRVIISGRVQGVGYRAWAVSTASNKGLRGWVRNRRDSSVEAVFSGEEDVVSAMIDECKEGPPASRVESIESYTHKEEFESPLFAAKPTE